MPKRTTARSEVPEDRARTPLRWRVKIRSLGAAGQFSAMWSNRTKMHDVIAESARQHLSGGVHQAREGKRVPGVHVDAVEARPATASGGGKS